VDTSLAYDRGPKLEAYARGGIPEVWVIGLIRHRVFVYRRPCLRSYQFALEAKGEDVLTVDAFADIIIRRPAHQPPLTNHRLDLTSQSPD
jgi:Uma2 family endonuclease